MKKYYKNSAGGVIALLLALYCSTVLSERRSDVAVSKFTSQADLDQLRWEAITDLHQSINGIVVSRNGRVTVADSNTWPMKSIVDAAHGNSSNVLVPLHISSKADAAAFLSSPVNRQHLAATAEQAVSFATTAGYDGLVLDIEGLKSASKPGYEAFVEACASALHAKDPTKKLLVTVYAPQLLNNAIQWSAYNISLLSETADFVFIMGYDMTWLGAKGGSGAKEAGPNSPLDGLSAVLKNSVHRWGAAPSKLILGLPAYGDLYTCDGDSSPAFGNCSTRSQKKKKSVDILAAAATGSNCIQGFDPQAFSPFFDCADGAHLPGSGARGVRQQGWFENLKSMNAKLDLASSFGLGGVGLWTGGGIVDNGQGKGIWDAFVRFLNSNH